MVYRKLALLWLITALTLTCSIQVQAKNEKGKKKADISGSDCKGKKCKLKAKPTKDLFTKSDIVMTMDGDDGEVVLDMDFVAQTFPFMSSTGQQGGDENIPSSWYGMDGDNGMNMIVDGNGVVYGSIQTSDEIITINGNGEMIARDLESFPDESPPLSDTDHDNIFRENERRNLAMSVFNSDDYASGSSKAGGGANATFSNRMLQDTNISTFDILVVWTAHAECHNSGEAKSCALTETTTNNMHGLISLAIAETNVAFAASGVYAHLKLVHAYRGDYTESSGSNEFDAALNHVTNKNDGKLDDVHAKRQQYGADLVSMIIKGTNYCGIAWLGPRIDRMFSVSSVDCATGYYSFGHEIGHNLVRRVAYVSS